MMTVTIHIDGLSDKTASIPDGKIPVVGESMKLFRDDFPSDKAYGEAIQNAVILLLGSFVRESRRKENMKTLEDNYRTAVKQAKVEPIDITDVIQEV